MPDPITGEKYTYEKVADLERTVMSLQAQVRSLSMRMNGAVVGNLTDGGHLTFEQLQKEAEYHGCDLIPSDKTLLEGMTDPDARI